VAPPITNEPIYFDRVPKTSRGRGKFRHCSTRTPRRRRYIDPIVVARYRLRIVVSPNRRLTCVKVHVPTFVYY